MHAAQRKREEFLEQAAATTELDEQTGDVQARVVVRERQVAALNATAGLAAASMEGLVLVLHARIDEMDRMQQLLRQVLRDEGEGPESTAVLVQITELQENIVGCLAELDAVDSDRTEALDAAAHILRQLQQHRAAGMGQAGTSEARQRQRQRELESELRIARSELSAMQLEGERRQRNISHMRASVEELRARYEQQQPEAFREAMQQPLPESFAAAVRATADNMGDMAQLGRAADVVRVTLMTLESELQSERQAAAAVTQGQLNLTARIRQLETQVADAQAQAAAATEAA
ncbi:hypothetical protein C2E20_5296 isoform B [Micractinium conductrix]|uniref:Uncharacterized protein n=1 Tax=Micractinium conductrix TaxID=554055 RepID=A0A2P6VB23_9CHLO|nr:hypothetical protein C2E20_5296 isoform B [Micractinium conductrix]|eukprot:PSC71299.1 hypothetical protein C2E20_5296 isoform B [Micractinium conductrix]